MRTTNQVFWNLMDLELLPERYNFWPHPQPHLLPLFFIWNRNRNRNGDRIENRNRIPGPGSR